MKRVLESLKAKKKLSSYDFKPLAEEGSNKKFYRLNKKSQNDSHILMIADDHNRVKGTLQDWIHIAAALNSTGVRTPKVYEYFKKENAVLMEDCKDHLLTDVINKLTIKKSFEKIKDYYSASLKLLQSAQKLNEGDLKYILGKKTLYNDLMLFYNEHIKKRIKKISKFWDEKKFLSEAETLCEFLNNSEKCFTHRDFHSRNILLLDKNLVLIDFQDACLGPRAYDLISFVFDPYTHLPIEQKKEIFFQSLELLKKELTQKQKEDLDNTWKAVTVQRLYKILGSYNYLGAMEGKEKFLDYIKPTLETLSHLDLFDKRWPYLTKILKEGIVSLGA